MEADMGMELPPIRKKAEFIADIEMFVSKWVCDEKLPNLRKLNSLELELIADAIFECENKVNSLEMELIGNPR